MKTRTWMAVSAAALLVACVSGASAQGIDQAVGGYSWADAAKGKAAAQSGAQMSSECSAARRSLPVAMSSTPV